MTPSKAPSLFALVAILVLVLGALPSLACSSDVDRGADACCGAATFDEAPTPEISLPSSSGAPDESPCCPGGCHHCSLPCCGGLTFALPLSLLSVVPADVPSDLAPLPPLALHSHLAVRDLDRPPRY